MVFGLRALLHVAGRNADGSLSGRRRPAAVVRLRCGGGNRFRIPAAVRYCDGAGRHPDARIGGVDPAAEVPGGAVPVRHMERRRAGVPGVSGIVPDRIRCMAGLLAAVLGQHGPFQSGRGRRPDHGPAELPFPGRLRIFAVSAGGAGLFRMDGVAAVAAAERGVAVAVLRRFAGRAGFMAPVLSGSVPAALLLGGDSDVRGTGFCRGTVVVQAGEGATCGLPG